MSRTASACARSVPHSEFENPLFSRSADIYFLWSLSSASRASDLGGISLNHRQLGIRTMMEQQYNALRPRVFQRCLETSGYAETFGWHRLVLCRAPACLKSPHTHAPYQRAAHPRAISWAVLLHIYRPLCPGPA